MMARALWPQNVLFLLHSLFLTPKQMLNFSGNFCQSQSKKEKPYGDEDQNCHNCSLEYEKEQHLKSFH